MKKLKYKLIKAICVALRCEELIEWDAYSDVVPSKRKPIASPLLNDLKFSGKYDEFFKNYSNSSFDEKLKDMIKKTPDHNFYHYEEGK